MFEGKYILNKSIMYMCVHIYAIVFPHVYIHYSLVTGNTIHNSDFDTHPSPFTPTPYF